mgnify:CR=1 FL=1
MDTDGGMGEGEVALVGPETEVCEYRLCLGGYGCGLWCRLVYTTLV